MNKRSLSGIKPTGDIHIGNYFGVIKQYIDMQSSFENFIFIADYHALNQINNPQNLSRGILEIAKAYLATGLDPQKTTLFRQSDIPQTTELCWIFNSITPYSLMKRAHAFKDAEAKNLPINMGLFDYPVLMAADILIYDSDIVPVGQDQKQHVEMAGEIARIFNNLYGETFKIPEVLIKDEVAIVKGLDGKKMSKSYNNTIGLFDNSEVVVKKVMSIVTDSKAQDEPKDPGTCNVFALHKLFSQNQLGELEKKYLEGKISYKESKEILAENVNLFLDPIREKKAELDNNEDYVLKVLKEGKDKVLPFAENKLFDVRKKIGIDFN